MTSPTPIDVVVACVKGSDEAGPSMAGLSTTELERVVQLAQWHLVEPAVYRIGDRLGDSTAAESLAAADRRNSLDQLKALADLARLATLLDDLGVGWVVLKGPALADVYYAAPELRSYMDLDVLVEPGRFGDVVAALEAAEAPLVDLNWDLIRSSRRGELSHLLWLGTELDLHWHPVTEARTRRRLSFETADLLGERVRAEIGGSSVPILGPRHQLPYVATHAVLAGGDRLRWYVDVARILDRDGPPSEATWRRARTEGSLPAMAIMIDRVAAVLDHPAAVAARDTVPRSIWRAAMRAAASVRPPVRVVDGHLGFRTLTRSTRGSTLQSVAATAESMWFEVLRPIATDRNHPWRRRVQGERGSGSAAANPLASPGGTVVDRDEFLRWVGSQERERARA